MPAWIYALAVVAVLWAVFVAVFHPFRKGAHAAPRALPVRVDAGSMVLAEERTAQFPTVLLTAPLPDPWEPLGPHLCCCHGGFSGEHDCCLHPRSAAPLVPLGGQLGPRARDVLDRYNARCVERWGHAITG